MSENNNKTTQQTDEELSSLLDSALEDFKNPPVSSSKPAKSEQEEVLEDVFNKNLMREASAVFQQHVSPDGGPLTRDKIEEAQQRMMEMMESPEFKNFASTITETIQGLNEGVDGIRQMDSSNLANVLDQTTPILPFMQGMMQNLLSKDVLYPSIKEISDKFPKWLKDNESQLSEIDKKKYENQRQLMVQVCEELEKENVCDEEEVKKQRFEKVLGLMQKMQDYGDPPAELVGSGDLPSMDGVQSDCVLM